MAEIAIVIRAGGTGTRLWPVSTAQVPKQFVAVLGRRTLLQETYARVAALGVEQIFVTTNAQHVKLVAEQLPELSPDHIICEPLKRNTGPAIAYETAALAALVHDDPVIAGIPADDFVGDATAFLKSVHEIATYVASHADEIVMPLTTPTIADGGLSYVRAEFLSGENFGHIRDWVEKPDQKTCADFVASGQWFAHTGMYFWKLSTAQKLFQMYAPQVWSAAAQVHAAMRAGDRDAATRIAATMPIISIESLVTKNFPHKIGYRADAWRWSDVGKWSVVKNLLHGDDHANSANHERVRFINAENNLVYGAAGKTVVCIGVHDLIIVDSGEQMLICNADDAAQIGTISEQLTASSRTAGTEGTGV